MSDQPHIKLVECPRDAMQGVHQFIKTETKAEYLNLLLQVGFDTLDFGSFVSPKAIPQMRDTADVLSRLLLDETETDLLAIVANKRGAVDAASFEQIKFLGYPFSISETFQRRNTNATINESLERVMQIQEICLRANKQLVVYISMGFGNPYGDPWNVEIVQKWVDYLADMEVHILSLSDTIGCATPESISYLFSNVVPEYPEVEFGAHMHTQPHNWEEKVKAAYESGCYRFDGALKGYGGCPMAKDDLTGNMPTEKVISYFDKIGINTGIDQKLLKEALNMIPDVFPL